jgi:CRP-like cAMP-binding protein
VALAAKVVEGEMALENLNFKLLAQQGCDSEIFAPGQEIFRMGDPGDKMFVVRSGEVEIILNGRVITTLASGEIFGEMGVIDGSPRAATARAKGECEVTPITQKAFLYLARETPTFALSVMRMLASRLRLMNEAA